MMSAIRDSLVQYVAIRRALGSKFYEPGLALDHFVDLLEREGSEFTTTDLALRWAMEPKLAQRATWGRRLSQVRGFAKWLNATDTRNVLRQHDENDWKTGEDIYLLTTLAALLHDLGKACRAFQMRLEGKLQERNQYRHEWVSLRLFEAFVGEDDDATWLARLDLIRGHPRVRSKLMTLFP